MSPRKFHRKLILVEVLSEEPKQFGSLADVYDAITNGECSGGYTTVADVEVDAEEIVRRLKVQGSDPSFFELDEDGNDTEMGEQLSEETSQ